MAMTLSELVGRAVDHDDLPAPIDGRLRVGAFVGLGLLGGFALFLWLGWTHIDFTDPKSAHLWFGTNLFKAAFTLGGHAQLAFRITVGILAVGSALAIITRGFRQARVAGLLGVYGVHLAGIVAALPMLVAALVIVAIVAVSIAIAALVIGCIIAALSGAGS